MANKDWRDQQSQLDHARSVIEQAQTDFIAGICVNHNRPGSEDYGLYWLGWIDAAMGAEWDEVHKP